MKLYLSVALVGLMGLVACSLTEEECTTGNWSELGVKDGARGLDDTHFDRYAKRCAKFDATPDRNAWEVGRQEGLKIYCTPANAYQLGKKGRRLRSSCAADLAAKMQIAYDDGRELYDIQRDIQSARSDLRDAHEIAATAAADSPQVAKAHSDIFFLRAEIQRLEWRYDRKEAELDRKYIRG